MCVCVCVCVCLCDNVHIFSREYFHVFPSRYSVRLTIFSKSELGFEHIIIALVDCDMNFFKTKYSSIIFIQTQVVQTQLISKVISLSSLNLSIVQGASVFYLSALSLAYIFLSFSLLIFQSVETCQPVAKCWRIDPPAELVISTTRCWRYTKCAD